MDEMRFQGAPVSEGIAIGSPFFFALAADDDIPEFPITVSEVDEEIARYRKALFSSREDLQKLQTHLVGEGEQDALSILDTHIQMLEDPFMTTNVEDTIRQRLQNTESVFHSVINDYETKLSQTADSFFQQRLIDVMDVSKRVMGHLCHKNPTSLADIPYNSIVIAKELIPSHTAAAQASRIRAFVTQTGGGNSHAALIARAKGIPYVASVDLELLMGAQGKCVIVDGRTGEVIINPKPATLEKYRKLKAQISTTYELLTHDGHLTAETIDGFHVKLYANVGVLSDLDTLQAQGASGVGLFRSEYLFFQNDNQFPSEEDQYAFYLKLIDKAQGLPIVIRVFDIGGDKNPVLFPEYGRETNPVLGCRGIRFLLKEKEVFKSQLRAILRASLHGNLRILLPLVSEIHELREAKALLEEIKKELKYKGNIPLGCMIEVPSSALICDYFAKECDFLSIGTNDLVQYTLGVDRSNPAMSDFCYPAHPSVIRMIKMITQECRRQNKPVSICGEIASNPLFVPLLLGLGLEEFSCSPRYLPLIKRTIREWTLLEAYHLAERVLFSSSSSEVAALLIDASRR